VKRLALRAATVLASVALGVAAVEGGYRALRLGGLSPTTHPAYVVHDAELGWRYRPSSRLRHRTAEFDVEIGINAEGFRGAEWDARAGRRRVLVLGDSFAFGWGVADDECAAARLARARPQWQVLNAAVSGYGPDQELLLLERLLPRVEPDAVAVVFCDNDVLEATLETAYGRRKPRFELTDGELRPRGLPVPESWLERWSYAYRALQKLRWQQAFAVERSPPQAGWALVDAIYRRMRHRLGQTPLLVVSESERVAALAAAAGIEHLDLRPALAQLPNARFARDRHWSPAGHAAVAAALAARLDLLLR
jgi:hypothetical protein